MTTAELVMSACSAIGLIFTVFAWVYGFGQMAGKLKAADERLDTLSTRIDGLEKDVQKVEQVRQALEAHAALTTAKFDAIGQQSRDGFERVAGEIRAFDRLVSSQLDEIKNRLRPTT